MGKEGNKSFNERLQEKMNIQNEDRMAELEEQNEYLSEKAKFLELQRKRNEKEVKRLLESNGGLSTLRDGIRRQLVTMMDVMKNWHEFKNELDDEHTQWEDKWNDQSHSLSQTVE